MGKISKKNISGTTGIEMQYKLVVVILTYNESIHIERAIKNVLGFADKIIVLDSYSEDNTTEIATQLGAAVIFRKFDDYKNQRQYAIDYCKNITQWMFFLDADEYLLEETKGEVLNAIKNGGVFGYYLNRRAIFMGRWLKHGGYYPCYFMRLFQPNHATVDGEINEHIVITGKTKKLKHDIVDHNLKDIFSWTEKHNKYTTIEAKRLFAPTISNKNTKRPNLRIQSNRKKWIRENIWDRLPLLFRPFIYFIYRYFFRLGFLDGKEGFIYHLLQGGWLWFLVDVKCIEIGMRCNDEENMKDDV